MQDDKKQEKKPLFAGPNGNKIKNIIIVSGLVGIALIFLSSLWDSGAVEQEVIPTTTAISAQEYTGQLEARLCEIISRIEGAGETQVMITLESGVKTQYATEERHVSQSTSETDNGLTRTETNEESEKQYIIVQDGNGAQRALAITEQQPVVKGVAVVCTGGGDPAVQQRIIDAVTTVLDLSSRKVCVTQSN